MKHFIIKSTIFSVFIIFTLAIGEILVRHQPNPYKIKNAWIQGNPESVKTLILGSSHTYYGVRPEFLDSAYNLANTSQNLKYDYFMLEHYASRCSNLRNVVLPISYFTFFSKEFEETKDWWIAINYKLYMGCPYHSWFSKYGAEVFHLPVYAGKIKSLIKGVTKIECDSLGWGTNFKAEDKPENWDGDVALKAVQRHTVDDWSSLDKNLSYFEKIKRFCRERNIRLVLITTPTYHTYFSQLDNRQLTKMNEIIKANADVEYYNFLRDSRFEDEDFYDSDHLSDVGAKKFSLLLKKEVF